MANDNINLVKSILADSKFSWTKPRQQVFEVISSKSPLSMNELINSLSAQIDRASVYRTVEVFEKLGIVRRIYIGWKYKIELSDQFVAHHHHLSCIKCGKTVDIEDERHIDQFIKEVALKFNFQPKNHQFEIDGICSDCQTK